VHRFDEGLEIMKDWRSSWRIEDLIAIWWKFVIWSSLKQMF